jgi:hypothetical protein
VRRKLFTFCAGVSLLLCLSVLVLWVRSYAGGDSVGWVSGQLDPPLAVEVHSLESSGGVLAIARERYTVPPLDAAELAAFRRQSARAPVRAGLKGWSKSPDRGFARRLTVVAAGGPDPKPRIVTANEVALLLRSDYDAANFIDLSSGAFRVVADGRCGIGQCKG